MMTEDEITKQIDQISQKISNSINTTTVISGQIRSELQNLNTSLKSNGKTTETFPIIIVQLDLNQKSNVVLNFGTIDFKLRLTGTLIKSHLIFKDSQFNNEIRIEKINSGQTLDGDQSTIRFESTMLKKLNILNVNIPDGALTINEHSPKEDLSISISGQTKLNHLILNKVKLHTLSCNNNSNECVLPSLTIQNSSITEETSLKKYFLMPISKVLKIQNCTVENKMTIENQNGSNTLNLIITKCNFQNDLEFKNCTFNGNADFLDINFMGESRKLIFEKCVASQNLVRINLQSKADSIVFNDCTLQKGLSIQNNTNKTDMATGELLFKSGTISNLELYVQVNSFKAKHIALGGEVLIEKCKFKNFQFEAVTLGDYISFRNTEFDAAPDVRCTAGFPDSCTFINSKYLELSSKLAEGRYRRIKKYMKDIGNEADEALFGSLELECRFNRIGYTDSFLEKLISVIYSAVNKYGRSISLPFTWIVALTLIMSFFYDQTNISINYRHPIEILQCDSNQVCAKKIIQQESWINGLEYWPEHRKSLLFSFINMLGPLKYTLNDVFEVKTGNAKALSHLQTLFSSILWFMLIVGVRRKFKTG